MLDLIKIVRNYLLTQTEVTDLVGERIYMTFSPVANTSYNYPMVILATNDGSTDSLTNDYYADLQIQIYTKGTSRVTSGNEVAREILLALDRKSFLAQTPKIYQVLKDGTTEVFQDEEQTYRKILFFNVVMEGYGGPSHPCDGV